MLGVALTIDGVQFLLNFIPFIGWIFVSLISIFAWLTFYLWFKLNGIPFLRGKAALLRITSILSVGGIIEIIPILNDLPAWTFAVAVMLVIVKLEDKMYNLNTKIGLNLSKLSGGKARANTGRMLRKVTPNY